MKISNFVYRRLGDIDNHIHNDMKMTFKKRSGGELLTWKRYNCQDLEDLSYNYLYEVATNVLSKWNRKYKFHEENYEVYFEDVNSYLRKYYYEKVLETINEICSQ